MKLLNVIFLSGLLLALSLSTLAEDNQTTDEWNFMDVLISGAKFESSFGVTNNAGTKFENGKLPINLDGDEETYDVSFGYSDKPIFRDIWAMSRDEPMGAYKGLKGSFFRTYILDAVKLDAKVGWGKTLKDFPSPGKFQDEEETNYTVTIKYELPLENIFSINKWKEE